MSTTVESSDDMSEFPLGTIVFPLQSVYEPANFYGIVLSHEPCKYIPSV